MELHEGILFLYISAFRHFLVDYVFLSVSEYIKLIYISYSYAVICLVNRLKSWRITLNESTLIGRALQEREIQLIVFKVLLSIYISTSCDIRQEAKLREGDGFCIYGYSRDHCS